MIGTATNLSIAGLMLDAMASGAGGAAKTSAVSPGSFRNRGENSSLVCATGTSSRP
jgi:hypothetical protein